MWRMYKGEVNVAQEELPGKTLDLNFKLINIKRSKILQLIDAT